MTFVEEKGGKKRVRAEFEIKSRGATTATRRKELQRFYARVRDVAKRHRGKLKVSK